MTINSLLDAGTAVIADVFDSLGILPKVLSVALNPMTPGTRFVGPAYTIVGRSFVGESGDRAKLGAIDAIPAGSVAIWSGTDIRGVCCFGDLLAEAMKARGCIGAVVDGGVRDVAYLRGLGLPVLARYRTPAQAIGRWKVTGSQVPVTVAGALEDVVTVTPGDIVVSDDDGVIIVRAKDVNSVLDKVATWSGTEDVSRSAIRDGLPLLAAIERFGHL